MSFFVKNQALAIIERLWALRTQKWLNLVVHISYVLSHSKAAGKTQRAVRALKRLLSIVFAFHVLSK